MHNCPVPLFSVKHPEARREPIVILKLQGGLSMNKLLLTGVAALAMTMGSSAYAAFPGFGNNPSGPEFLNHLQC
jgi:hypothetical protein